jgi:glucose/arabinose dehydrogenase
MRLTVSTMIAALITGCTVRSQSVLTHGRIPELPLPNATPVVNNPAKLVPPPPGFKPTVPEGFAVSLLAEGFEEPRWLAVNQNGDVFVSDSAAGRIVVLKAPRGEVVSRENFAEGLKLPFGIAFLGHHVYIAEVHRVSRFPYDPATSRREGPQEHVLDLPGLAAVDSPRVYAHWTRAIALSPDRTRIFVAVGTSTSASLADEPERALVLSSDLDGKNAKTYATGLRNAIGLAFHPETGQLWATVNERGNLGDDLPPDYLTQVREGGFFGFPYAYVGPHADLRVQPQRPDLVAKTIVPDLLLPAHSSPLQLAFYQRGPFPPPYDEGAFIAEHGSSNRSVKVGYEVSFVPFRKGKPIGGPQPFLTGLVPDPAKPEVYGRPVGVAVAADGSLLVSDDGAKVIWRVAFSGPTEGRTRGH